MTPLLELPLMTVWKMGQEAACRYDGCGNRYPLGPTDATLLWDTVRVLTRLIGRLREIVPKDIPHFPNRKRAARKRMQKLQRMTAAQRENQQVRTYRQLLTITQEVLANARRTLGSDGAIARKNSNRRADC